SRGSAPAAFLPTRVPLHRSSPARVPHRESSRPTENRRLEAVQRSSRRVRSTIQTEHAACFVRCDGTMKAPALLMVLSCIAGARGCRDVNRLGPTGGGGAESLEPGQPPIDAYESPRRDSMLRGDAEPIDAARADDAADAHGGDEAACNACEAQQC